MSEELELVTDFASLRAGDLVVVKDCARNQCGATHRFMLTRKIHGPSVDQRTGKIGTGDGWHGFPASRCFKFHLLCSNAVDEKRVYRVIIPPAAEVRETARPKKPERA